MKRKLELQGITSGDTVRDILEVFPEIESSFEQRKQFDEYYFTQVEVELTIDKIESLTKLGFAISINWERILLT
jgi:hypothetical protein